MGSCRSPGKGGKREREKGREQVGRLGFSVGLVVKAQTWE